MEAAAGGLPRSLASTLSASADMPGGGLVVLGLGESDGVAVVARQALDPPVTLVAEQVVVESRTLVVARVDELATSATPCRARTSGRAYLRVHDGDPGLSQVPR